MAIAEQIIKHEGSAIIFDGRELSYSTVKNIAMQTAGYLQHHGYRSVAFKVGNHQAYVPVFLGCVLHGAHPFLLHPHHAGNEMLLEQIQPDLIIDDMDEFLLKIEGTTDFRLNAVRDESSNFFIGFTSGTTGLPKGYRRTERSWLDSFVLNNDIFKLDAVKYFVAGGPLYHSLTLFAAISALYEGKTIYLMSEFSAEQIPDDLEVAIFGVPSMLEMMMKHPSDAKWIFLSSGAKLEQHTLIKAKQRFPNMRIYEYFGSSEASYISYLTPEDREKHPLSVGKLFPEVEEKISEDGSLMLKSPYMFTGYYGQPDHEGYIATGDICEIIDGYLYIRGRKNNRIIVGGKNVFPEEIERVIINQINIKDVMITSKHHYLLGEVVVAIIHPRGDFIIKDVREHLEQQLEKYKRPLKWIIDGDFIYTDSGKIARAQMRERHGLD